MENNRKIMGFADFINESNFIHTGVSENYEYENFTLSDMEDVKEYWNDGAKDIYSENKEEAIKFISQETMLNIDIVRQIILSMLKSKQISEVNEPGYEAEDCDGCRDSMEEDGIEYTPDFTWKHDTWYCDHCNQPV